MFCGTKTLLPIDVKPAEVALSFIALFYMHQMIIQSHITTGGGRNNLPHTQ